jgi:alpha-N-arabinofuranosidase
MAVGEQAEKHLDEYQAMALEECGRALPIAITEYNGPLSPDRAPYRFSYGVALECADLLRIYLQPEHHVLAANYWQFLNGAFGMVRSDRNAPDGGKIEEKPAYALFQLWAGHLGARLVAVHVDGPRATYRGSGSVYPATGDALVPSRQLGKMPIDGRFDFSNLNAGITAKSGTGGAFTLVLAGVTGETYPRLARLPKPGVTGACDYEVTFEARFVPDSGSQTVPVGLGVEDARGWPVTRSAIAINGIGTEWKAFRGQYHALPDTATVEIQARFEFGTTRVSGRLEVRGLQIEASSAPTYPAYSLLTATASTSEDGKTLHLIVFNKSAGQDIPARLNVAGFHPASASVWEVHGLRLEARDGVAETVLGAPLDVAGAEPVHTFPAHSMTAIDFVAAAGQQAK